MAQPVHRRRRPSERHPWLYPLAVWVGRCRRRLRWLRGDEVWAVRRTPPADLPVRVKAHRSLLSRQLGDSEMYLQHNGVGERCLEGELRADREQPTSFTVFARDERFYRLGAEYFGANEMWRTVTDRRTGNTVGEELLRRNCALVTYVPENVDVRRTHSAAAAANDPRAVADSLPKVAEGDVVGALLAAAYRSGIVGRRHS